jgi:hypothetical protein
MTLPFERTNAVLNTKQFLLDLMDSRLTPKIPKEIRHKARSLLKHYPSAMDLFIAEELFKQGANQNLFQFPFSSTNPFCMSNQEELHKNNE